MSALTEVSPRAGAVTTVEGIVDVLAASRLKSAIAILIVALACFLPGLATLAPFDREETQSVLATQRMAQSGDYSQPRLVEEPMRFLPIGVYWLEGLAAWAFGPALSSYRLPAMFGAVAASLLTWWTALAFGRPRAALLAALLMSVSFVLVGESKVARADSLLLAAVVLSQGALARLWLRRDDDPDYLQALLFWTGLGLGIYVAGLTAAVILALTIAVLSFEKGGFAWLRRLAPMAGAVWLLFLLTPWLIAMSIAAGSDPPVDAALVRLAVQNDLEVPPGIHAVVLGLTFWPAAAFAALAVPFALDNARRRVVFFALAWALPSWAFIELFAARLPQSILPICPALAIIAATAIDEGAVRRTGWLAWLVRFSLVIVPLIIGLILLALLWPENAPAASMAMAGLAAGVAVAGLAWRWLQTGVSQVGAAALAVIAAALFHLGVFGMTVPKFDGLRTAERLMAAARAIVPCDKPQFVSTGFREPSLLLAGGDAVRLTGSVGAADFLNAGDCRAAFVELGRQASFRQRAADLGLNVVVKGEVTGFNTGNLRPVAMRIVTRAGGP